MTNEELYRQYVSGETEAYGLLYEQMMPFVRAIAIETLERFNCRRDDMLDDLCAEGAVEFCERIQCSSYDESRGRLTTYLHPFLRGRMYRYMEANLGVMALSKDEMQRVRSAQQLYYDAGQSTEEIAAQLGVSENAAAKAIAYNTHSLAMSDLQTDNEADEVFGWLSELSAADTEQTVYRNTCLELLEGLFQQLSAKDKYILGHSYGIYGYEKLSADELGLREMLTQDGVTKAKKAALEHLRQLYPGSALQRWQSIYG